MNYSIQNNKLYFNGAPSQPLRGISLTGFETGTREKPSGGGYWLFGLDSLSNNKSIMDNIARVLIEDWGATIIRLPVCSSGYVQNYWIQNWSDKKIISYRDWIDYMIQAIHKIDPNVPVIIDNHLWVVSGDINTKSITYMDYTNQEKTISLTDIESCCDNNNNVDSVYSCPDKNPIDFPEIWSEAKCTQTSGNCDWQCAIANADGCNLHSAAYNIENLKEFWNLVASRYKNNPNVWFELYNEPYVRKKKNKDQSCHGAFDNGENFADEDYPWDLWYYVIWEMLTTIRDTVKASNIVIVSGLDWGGDFLNVNPSIKNIDRLYTNIQQKGNIMWNFHVYQNAACCGQIADDKGNTDLSKTDPYQSIFCTYYDDGQHFKSSGSNSSLPYTVGQWDETNSSCTWTGYDETTDKKSPPCTWVANGYNPKTGSKNGLCAGDRACNSFSTKDECETAAKNSATEYLYGWDKHALFMEKYGPIIMTEFGTYDCSTPYIYRLLTWAQEHNISWTAWATWPQNDEYPGNGSCSYPSITAPYLLKNGRITESDWSCCASDSYEDISQRCNKYGYEECKNVFSVNGFYGQMIKDFMKQSGPPTPSPPSPPPTSPPSPPPTSPPSPPPTSPPSPPPTSPPSPPPTSPPSPPPTSPPSPPPTSPPSPPPTSPPSPPPTSPPSPPPTPKNNGLFWTLIIGIIILLLIFFLIIFVFYKKK